MRERLSEVILNSTLTVVAILFAGIIIRRELRPEPSRQAPDLSPPGYVMDWQDLIPTRLSSNLGAPIQLVEFIDYECGFCKIYEETTEKMLRENPGQFSVAYVHLPIPGHRFARLAASAAECANQAGQFSRMHRALFDKQDSLGLKRWIELARESGIADTVSFEKCLNAEETAQTIESDYQLARALGVNATPTVLVNGWKMPVAPTAEELLAIAKTIGTDTQWSPEGGDTIYRKPVNRQSTKSRER